MHKTCYKQYRKNKCGNGKISREGREREKWTNKYGAHCPSFATVCGPVTVNCNCVSGTLTVNAAGRVKIVGRNGKSGCRRLCPCFARASSWPTYCCCCVSTPYPSLSLPVPLYWAVSFSLSLAVFLISCAALLSTYCSICCTAKFLLRRFSSYFGHRQQPYNLRQVICLTGPEREGKTGKQLPDETGKTLPTSWQWP